MYAIIQTGGKQYTVKVGDVLRVEKLEAADESSYTIKEVLAVGKDGSLKVGKPYVDGASVTAKVLASGRGKKLNVLTYRPKKDSKRKMGHRQPFTKLEITAING